ncbi:hypothetical protein [Streptomyces sp. NPDC058644]|uniref:hypothetical protein n=1 Tax=unclassified Streptomyces TaxID=2593676 RepID=UPI00365550BE
MTSVTWPVDVDRRLSVLVRAAAAAGERTSRSELLAALMTAAEVDPEQLADLLHRYRRLPADALADENCRDDLPVVRTPGPRRVSSS